MSNPIAAPDAELTEMVARAMELMSDDDAADLFEQVLSDLYIGARHKGWEHRHADAYIVDCAHAIKSMMVMNSCAGSC